MAFLSDVYKGFIANSHLLIYSILLLSISYIVIDTFIAWYRLRHFKGPLFASFSNIWLLKHVAGGRMHLDFAEVCQSYGSLARIGPNDLITSDPAIIRRISAARSKYQRSGWYVSMKFDPRRDNVESERDEAKHSALRSKMAAGYSGKEVETLEKSIDDNVLAFVQLIDSYVPAGHEYKPLDFGRKAQYFTLDVISTVAFGQPFNYLGTDSDVHDYIRTTDKVLTTLFSLATFPWILRFLQSRLMRRFLPSAEDSVGFGKIMQIAKQVVDERFGPNKKKQSDDMLSSFIRHGMNKEEAESETILTILAGSDTTAGAIRATFLYIITNPRILQSLRSEIADASISSPIKDSEARNLTYLQAIIKEGLRIWPPVTGLMPKVVPPGGDVIDGVFIPEGTSIGYCAFGLFRDKTVWGEDANVFRPERWLDSSPEKIKEMEQTLELVFAAGRWQCLGKNVALMELNKVFVELLRRFDFVLIDPTKPWKLVCNGVFSISEMWMTVSRRSSS